MTRPRFARLPANGLAHHMVDPTHADCIVCAPVVAARAHQIADALREIHAASLRADARSQRQGEPTKQETPRTAIPEVSTRTTCAQQEARAARAQSDTRR